MKLNIKGHVSRRFEERFPDMSYEMMRHHFRTGKYITIPKKEGEFGKVIKKIKKGRIIFKFTIRQEEITIITVKK